MNFPKPIAGTSKSKLPHRSEGADVPQALNQSGAVNASPFLAEPSNLTGEAGAPRSLPTNPDCTKCGRGYWVCICGCPEPEQECFRPALNRDPDWYRIEL